MSLLKYSTLNKVKQHRPNLHCNADKHVFMATPACNIICFPYFWMSNMHIFAAQ